MAARQAQIDDLNRKHGLRPGHNRAKARTQREAFPTFKESVKTSNRRTAVLINERENRQASIDPANHQNLETFARDLLIKRNPTLL